MESCSYPVAWRPLTPRGVAAFARASFGRVFVIQFVVALLAAGTVAWALKRALFPTLGAAVEHLPLQGQISSGQLTWPADSPALLAESRFLAIVVDLNHTSQTRSPAHFQAEFGQGDLRFYSLFGCWSINYPRDYRVGFNYQEAKPWWGAWAPILLATSTAVTIAGLMTSWAILATLYSVAVWLLGLYGNRELTLLGSWRLAAAALMPGALVMVIAIGFYALGQFDLVQFLAAFILHFVIGWAYLVMGTLAVPKLGAPNSKLNPFTPPAGQGATPEPARQKEFQNPFRPSGD